MDKTIIEAITNKRKLLFWYESKDGDMVQRETTPVCYGTDKNGNLKLRAFDSTDIPKLWLVDKMQGVELGETYTLTQEPTPVDKHIPNVIAKVV